MSVNFTILAQNSDVDYVKQAYLCALSIKATNPNSKICLITNNLITEKIRSLFDNVVDIPWEDSAENSQWKIENRWKIYHATPYNNTIVLDSDTLVLENIEHWNNFLKNYKVFFSTHVVDYRGIKITDSYYRKAFRNHNLPNLYSAFNYFEKSDEAHLFYKWLELVMNNWELFYGQYAGGKYFQKFPSLDVSASIVTKILNCKNKITSPTTSYPYIVHMKPKCQNWKLLPTEKWQDKVGVYIDNNLNLKIGNFKQSGIFHYTEKDFVNDEIISIYERYLGV